MIGYFLKQVFLAFAAGFVFVVTGLLLMFLTLLATHDGTWLLVGGAWLIIGLVAAYRFYFSN